MNDGLRMDVDGCCWVPKDSEPEKTEIGGVSHYPIIHPLAYRRHAIVDCDICKVLGGIRFTHTHYMIWIDMGIHSIHI